MNDIAIIVVGGAVIFTCGIGLGFWIGLARGRGLGRQARHVQAEFDQFREQVTEHFSETASHFQTLGNQYRALYEHMASGAERFCNGSSAERAISFSASAMLPHKTRDEADDPGEGQQQPESTGQEERPEVRQESAGPSASVASDSADEDTEPRPVEAAKAAQADLPEAEKDKKAEPLQTYH